MRKRGERRREAEGVRGERERRDLKTEREWEKVIAREREREYEMERVERGTVD